MSQYRWLYPGTIEMSSHDAASELVRWFMNYRLDKTVHPPNRLEWMTISRAEKKCGRREISFYSGVIGNDRSPFTRSVRFEPGSPPPPIYYHQAEEPMEPPRPFKQARPFGEYLEYLRPPPTARDWYYDDSIEPAKALVDIAVRRLHPHLESRREFMEPPSLGRSNIDLTERGLPPKDLTRRNQ